MFKQARPIEYVLVFANCSDVEHILVFARRNIEYDLMDVERYV